MCQIFENKNWIEENFGAADFRDKRLNSRLKKTVEKIIEKPEASLPQQMGGWADVTACYRLLNNRSVTHKRILTPHVRKTRLEVSKTKGKVTLFVQDGSEIETQRTTKGAGPIGNHTCRGIMMHNCLAIEYDEENPRVIGVANQRIWERDDVSLRKTETRQQRNKRTGKESEHWLKTLKNIGSPPEGCTWVSVGDRGNDIYEFFSESQQLGWDAVVRVSQDRKIQVDDDQEFLKQWVSELSISGTRTITIRRKGETKSREITMSVAYGKTSICPPQRIAHKEKPIDIHVIRCFNEEEDLDWILYSTIPINNFEEAVEKIQWYACRWIIEEYHKCLKTGCKIESNQFESIDPVESLLGILSIVALLMLQMKYLSRKDDGTLAQEVVGPIAVMIICKRYKLDKDKLTVKQFWRSVAQFGGFLGRKADGDPGWQTLWRGWLRILDMCIGAELLSDMQEHVI